MEYTLFQDFARKIQRPEPPTSGSGRVQSGRTPEFWLRALIIVYNNPEKVPNWKAWFPEMFLFSYLASQE